MELPTAPTPIACDMTSAPDTTAERMMEYRRLFTRALVGRERTAEGIRLRFRAGDGVEAWVRDLAAREQACCPFFNSDIDTKGEEVHWNASVIDDDIARAVLDEFYTLPDTVADGVEALEDRFRARGLQIVDAS
jgi:predicted phage gp36 major capsid-like protein